VLAIRKSGHPPRAFGEIGAVRLDHQRSRRPGAILRWTCGPQSLTHRIAGNVQPTGDLPNALSLPVQAANLRPRVVCEHVIGPLQLVPRRAASRSTFHPLGSPGGWVKIQIVVPGQFTGAEPDLTTGPGLSCERSRGIKLEVPAENFISDHEERSSL